MDFVIELLRNCKKNDSILVVIDRLTKSSHFLATRVPDSVDQLANLYILETIRLHGIPVSIILDRDPIFTSKF